MFSRFVELSNEVLRLGDLFSSPNHITLGTDDADQFLEFRVENTDDFFSEGVAVGWQFRSDIEGKLIDWRGVVFEFDFIEIGEEAGFPALFGDCLGPLGGSGEKQLG